MTTYFILLSRHGNSFLYRSLYNRANSSSIVPLLLALSQVTCPSYPYMSTKDNNCDTKSNYLMCDPNLVQYLEHSTTETLPVMSIIHLSKSEQCAFALPLGRTILLNPMASNSEIAIRITGLPSITCDVYSATDSITLIRHRATIRRNMKMSKRIAKRSHIQCHLQLRQVVFEYTNDLSTCCLPSGNFDAVGSMGRDVNHIFEFWMIEGLYGLDTANVS